MSIMLWGQLYFFLCEWLSGLLAIGASCSLADKESMLMSNSVKRMLFVTVGMVISFAANAFDLNGAWSGDN